MGEYNVAFAYTHKAGGYEGIVTWTSFESKESFDAWYTDDIKDKQRVVEEGISPERCIELVHLTPAVCRVSAAYEKATDPETGEIDKKMLEMHLRVAQFAIAEGRK